MASFIQFTNLDGIAVSLNPAHIIRLEMQNHHHGGRLQLVTFVYHTTSGDTHGVPVKENYDTVREALATHRG